MATFEDLEHAEVETPSVLAVQLSSRSKSEPASIAEAMGAAFGSLITFIQSASRQWLTHRTGPIILRK